MHREEQQNVIQEHLENSLKFIKRDLGLSDDSGMFASMAIELEDNEVTTALIIQGLSRTDTVGTMEIIKNQYLNK